jgi:pimeloyl-ACP methyl ester carboxylesterase
MAAPDSQVLETSPLNSTIVRSLKWSALRLFRAAAGRVGQLSPELAARLAQRRFFTPPRAPLREAERSILEGGRPFRFEVDGRSVVGWRWGEGPAALLVHGWGGHAGQMTELVAPLVRAGFEAVAVDLPGHGASAGSRSSIVHFARAIEAAVRHLGGIDVLLAHSFGAAGATLALSRGLRVRRALYLAPPASFERIWARFRAGAGLSPPVWQRLLRLSELWLGVPLNGLEPVRLAPQLQVPLLILHDAGDRELPFSEGVELAAAWPGAVLRRLEGLGHLRLLKDAATVHEAVSFVAPPAGRRPSVATRTAEAALVLV